ncbi:MAG: DnaD domain protein [Bacilli bacterium]|nr:DnaD domain protein [Bacilli bacterium]
MNDLKAQFKSKDFLVNANVIKNISSLDITLDEFLLFLYFTNISFDLNLEDINEKLGFTDEKTFKTFNSLINKKYIEIKVSKNHGKVEEKIVLDTFYDRLILNKKEEKNNSDIFSLFEKELGRTLSSFEYEIINKWLENNISEELISKALKEAILSGVTNFKYIDKIVYEWNKKGIKSKIEKEKPITEELFDYDWLGEED